MLFAYRSVPVISVWDSYRLGNMENGFLANYNEYEPANFFDNGLAIRSVFRRLYRVCSCNGTKEKYDLRKSPMKSELRSIEL